MQNREISYLKSIIKHCRNIEAIHAEYEYSHEKYYTSPGYQYSISFCVEQIGELVVKFRNEGYAENYKNIPWHKIAGMRNRIAHGYDSIDLDMVYHISVNDIPQLLKNCEEILKEKDEQI
ncbi:MAG: DUF86 domain-containing protein [Ruminococcaceae bacterium]|nr:DUF86 domain-containing protein [Oscillospiraceae bacterium]